MVNFTMTSRVQQHVYCFFERATHQATNFLSIDTMTCDGHEITLGCHHIHEQRQMTIVDVGAVKRNDIVHFFLDRFAACFDTQCLQTLDYIIGIGTTLIDVICAEYFHECGTVCFKYPFADRLEFTLVANLDSFLFFFDRLGHVDLGNSLDSLQCHVRQDILFDQL